MPNTKSGKKRHKQDEVIRLRNRAKRSAIKTEVRKVRDAVSEGKLDVADTEFRVAVKKLDKAVSAGVMHANAASRSKSRLSLAIKAAKQKSPKAAAKSK